MSTIELVDPELRDALAQPLLPLTAETLMRRRANALEPIAAVPKPNLPDIATDEIHVESAFGAKPIRVLTYRPVTSNDPLPVIVHIHGGGFVMGAPEMKDVENRLFASELRCAIYSVDHRLAPESPHPAPVEDIYSVFNWLHANAGQLGFDPARIGIKGESGGGGFAAAAALYARDRQGPKFAFQHLIYPMIDDRTAVRRTCTPTSASLFGRKRTTISAGVRCSARSRVRPVSRLMRRQRARRMCPACRQPTFRSAVSISSLKKT
jgi:triacylglycerol lipase